MSYTSDLFAETKLGGVKFGKTFEVDEDSRRRCCSMVTLEPDRRFLKDFMVLPVSPACAISARHNLLSGGRTASGLDGKERERGRKTERMRSEVGGHNKDEA